MTDNMPKGALLAIIVVGILALGFVVFKFAGSGPKTPPRGVMPTAAPGDAGAMTAPAPPAPQAPPS